MKYKNLKSMAHNHTHSFVSWMNHVDDIYILDELRDLFNKIDEREIIVTWLPSHSCSTERSDTLIKSIGFWADHLPKHLDSHNVSADQIASFITRISITARFGLTVESILQDDRGREYKQRVQC